MRQHSIFSKIILFLIMIINNKKNTKNHKDNNMQNQEQPMYHQSHRNLKNNKRKKCKQQLLIPKPLQTNNSLMNLTSFRLQQTLQSNNNRILCHFSKDHLNNSIVLITNNNNNILIMKSKVEEVKLIWKKKASIKMTILNFKAIKKNPIT